MMATSNNPPSDSRARFDRADTSRPAAPRGGEAEFLQSRVLEFREKLEARADSNLAAGLRADVAEARNLVKGFEPDKAISRTTSDRYRASVDRMRSTGKSPRDAACKSSFEAQRAALVHVTRSELKTDLRELDRFRKKGDLQNASQSYSRVRSGLEILREYPPSTGAREQDFKRTSAFNADRAVKSNSKRTSLNDLRGNWKDEVQAEARTDDRSAVALMSLTGCRPSEVRGAKISQTADALTIEIKGSKLDDFRGVRSREIVLSKDELKERQAGRDLLNFVGGRDVRKIDYEGSTADFRNRVNAAFSRAGHEEGSCYSYRHAATRDLREAGASRSEIAERLGHRSTDSQRAYG